MSMQKCIYIHFKEKPSDEQLEKYFSKYPEYVKMLDNSYRFCVPQAVQRERLRDWAAECFPHKVYVLCFGTIELHGELPNPTHTPE